MNAESLVLSAYSHESCLPCKLNEIVVHIKKRNITANRNKKVGLNKDIYVIPLNRGYLIHTKKSVFVTNNLQSFLQLDGTFTVGELSSTPEMESNLKQLNYYNLLQMVDN